MLASKTDVIGENCSIYIPTKVPMVMGIIKPYTPRRLLLTTFFLKSFMSISRPARNMM